MSTSRPNLHFLIVCLAYQGQIAPTRNLARRIARLTGARVTIATPLSSHRRLFPTSTSSAGEPDDTTQEHPLNPDGSGIISYAPYSDGFDDGFHPQAGSGDHYMSELKSVGSRTLAALANALAAGGRQVTCVIYAILLTWAADIARCLGVRSFLYWIQPASLFAIYHWYFRGHRDFTSRFIEFPGLPRLRVEELPSILSSPSPFRSSIEEVFVELGRSEEKQRVLVNTFHKLEAAAMERISGVELLAVGPLAGEELDKEVREGYIEWLEAQEKGSVVYVAFGSITRPSARQVEEIACALKESRRPYLWVQRKDSESRIVAEEGKGMVVEWCDQMRVLGHGAVGCFVTHCGWNSMMEAMMKGVPMVMLPGWVDQTTNAALAEMEWEIGVRLEAGEDGVVEAVELRRCIGTVLGEGERGKAIRKRAEEWKKKAAEAVADDGPSTRNLKVFLAGL